MTILDRNFTPGPTDVICAPGKEARNHPGNITFRKMIQANVEKYSNATSKLEKSLIVSSIVDKIREGSPDGGFVKMNTETGYWYKVGDQMVREKVGQSLRDCLHSQYRSSTKAKKRRRKEEVSKLDNEVGEFVQTNCKAISNRIKLISSHVNNEADIQNLFDQANSDLLCVLKENETRRVNKRKLEQYAAVEVESLGKISDFEPRPLNEAFESIFYSSFSENRIKRRKVENSRPFEVESPRKISDFEVRPNEAFERICYSSFRENRNKFEQNHISVESLSKISDLEPRPLNDSSQHKFCSSSFWTIPPTSISLY